MDEAAITRYIETTFEGVDVVVASEENGAPQIAWGDSFFSYDPNQRLPEALRFRSRRSLPRTTAISTISQTSTAQESSV